MKNYCVKIAPYVDYYKKQIDYYNQTAYKIITIELALILPTFSKTGRDKRKVSLHLLKQVLSVWHMKVYPAFYTIKDKGLYMKQLRLWKIKWICNAIESFIWKIQWSCKVYIIQMP